MTPSGIAAVGSARAARAAAPPAQPPTPPVAPSPPPTAAATVPTASSAANPAGSTYGAGRPPRQGGRRSASRRHIGGVDSCCFAAVQADVSGRLLPVILKVIQS